MSPLRARLAASISAVVLAIASSTVGAQATATPRNVQAAGGFITAQSHRDIPLATARALIAAHHPDVVDGSLDPAIITLLLDTNNGYITSVASKPAVVMRAADGSVAAAAGGFAVAGGGVGGVGGVVRATPIATSGTAGANFAGAAPSASITIGGIGSIDAALVEEMFWVSYAAGDLGPNAVRVRYVILKNAPK